MGWAVSYPVLRGPALVELLEDIEGLELGDAEVTVDLVEYDPMRDPGQVGGRVAVMILNSLMTLLHSD